MPLKLTQAHRLNRTVNLLAGAVALTLAIATTPLAHAEVSAEAVLEKSTATTPAHWTDIESVVTTAPRVFTGSEGQDHLLYELVLTNYNRQAVIFDSISIVDAAHTDKVVSELTGKDLDAAMLNLTSHGPNNRAEAGQVKIVYINIDVPKGYDMPASLMHHIRYHMTTGKDRAVKDTYTPPFSLSTQKAVIIGSPLRGKDWLACGGYASMQGHRRSLFPLDNKLLCAQRFAIDWIQISDDSYSTKKPVDDLNNSTCFKKTIYAVADGVVAGVVNKFDNQPIHIPSGDRYYAGGNTITIKDDDGYYAFYAHLLKDSARVKAGDRVKRGDPIATLGNSGNSTGPHLHFHLTDGPNPLGADGVPYVFDRFSVTGQVKDMDRFFKNDDAGLKQTIDKPDHPGEHSNELIREGAVVDFADEK